LTYPDLFAYGRKFGVSNEALKDILHDLFVKLFTHPETVTNAETLLSFLYISVRNACINRLNYENRRVALGELSDFELPVSIDPNRLEEAEDAAELTAKIERIMNKLTPRQREIIYLRFFQNREYDDIAVIMNLSNQTVRNLIHKALERVRKDNPLK
jgi:RNA polymerase sigma factor (sigma-70 family)